MSEKYPNEDVRVDGINGRRTYLSTFYSLREFAESSIRRASQLSGSVVDRRALQRAREIAALINGDGSTMRLDEVVEAAESAVTLIEAEYLQDAFLPVHDVTGSDVDVARYLSGEPENMVEYPVHEIPKQGRVLAMIASTDAMACVGSDAFRDRGITLTAFAIALERLGYTTEFWVDMGAHFSSRGGSYHSHIRVKGPNDVLDPAMLMLAYCDERMLHGLEFCAEDGNRVSRSNQGGGRGASERVLEYGLPDDMIVIPDAMMEGDVKSQLVAYLRQTGLITD